MSHPVGRVLAASRAASGRPPVAAWLVGLAVTSVYIGYSATQWHRLESPSWDLGIFTQLAKAYAAPGAPIVPIKGHGFNLLGDHFHPLLVLLGPVYAVFPSAFTLLVVQNLLFGLAVFVVTRVGVRQAGRLAGTCIGVAFGLSWGLQSAVAAQFHEIAFAVPLLALSLESVIDRRLLPAVAWGSLLVFVKEDLGVTVLVLGLVIAWRFRSQAGLWLAAWGALWLVLSVRVILPALNTGGAYDYSDRIDVGRMLADPGLALVSLVSGVAKYETVGLLLLAGGVLFVRSPLALVAVPTLLWRFVSIQEGYWGPDWHYSAVLMPVIFLALVDVLGRSRTSGRKWLRAGSLIAAPAVAVVAVVLLPGQAFADLAKPQTYEQSPRWDAAHRMMDSIPAEASVESGVVLMAYLAPDVEVYWLGNENPAPEYLIVDAEDWSWGPVRPADAVVHAEATYPGSSYELIFDEAGYQLVRKAQ
ncbi:DUF2079 domain-containing protein [Arthrobacter sp. Br18]|uniref:DUF2079 domain-containing protein n=1 Tax=Arthrobacter sp. Br18 TaxID=1312954 RepID=UPI0004B182E7|nr:DUF2079 domain-containing protein [Arthrobacter sp. Br18]